VSLVWLTILSQFPYHSEEDILSWRFVNDLVVHWSCDTMGSVLLDIVAGTGCWWFGRLGVLHAREVSDVSLVFGNAECSVL
jgi:hypothetical protein